jgi:hypothetical protein
MGDEPGRRVIAPETALERRIVDDPEWQAGAAWGMPRPGHPEGSVAAHIEELLANIDDQALGALDRERLRFVALVHDTFKHRVDRDQPRTGDNHHAAIARRFAARYTRDAELLELVELHDEAYNAWVNGHAAGTGRRRRLAHAGCWIALAHLARSTSGSTAPTRTPATRPPSRSPGSNGSPRSATRTDAAEATSTDASVAWKSPC